MVQLELEFGDPPGFEDLRRYVGKNIAAKSEDNWAILLTPPWFHWRTGQWRALANANGALCLIALTVRRETRES